MNEAAATLTVNLAERSYPIHFGTGLGADFACWREAQEGSGRRVAVVADRRLAARQAEALTTWGGGAPRFLLPSGERAKCLRQLGRVWDFLAEARVDRLGVLVALGGGVTGDLAGFAAASYLRGIDLVQVPTTLLAMVDSSVGGKTGLNLPAGKNLAGAFWQPRAVWIDTAFLRTLPRREFAAGLAEVIKYGLLADPDLFAQLERVAGELHPGHPELPGIIRRCCAIKAAIVGDDERETRAGGGRMFLNLGHTFGHAVEKVAGYGAYLHGEAVAIGLVRAAELSRRLGFLAEDEVQRVRAVVAAARLPVELRAPLPEAELRAAMLSDKKARAGTVRYVVLRRIGECAMHEGEATF